MQQNYTINKQQKSGNFPNIYKLSNSFLNTHESKKKPNKIGKYFDWAKQNLKDYRKY